MFRMFPEDAVWTAESCLVSSLSNRQQIILMIGRTKWRSALTFFAQVFILQSMYVKIVLFAMRAAYIFCMEDCSGISLPTV